MSESTHNLDRISALRAEIAQLERAAVHELHARRDSIKKQLDELDAEIERITGKAPRASKGRSGRGGNTRVVSLQELKDLLEKAADHTINVRKLKLDFSVIKGFVHAHPQTFKLGGKGPWPTVSLHK